MVADLTAQQVRRIHHKVIEAIEGERDTCLHPGIQHKLPSSCLDRPRTQIYGYTPYPNIFLKAASLIECIISTHALIKGTKRTGFPSVRSLPNTRWLLLRSQSTDKEFRVSYCAKRPELPAIADWLKLHALRK